MSRKLRALDLFCGAGGAARGLIAAGFEVVGVDNVEQPRYPGEFRLGNALRYWGDYPDFDFVWASPPCQAHTMLKHAHNAKQHYNLIPGTRRLLERIGKPYVIENVPGAPLIDPLTLCGSMFGLTAKTEDGRVLQLQRHRRFECSFEVGRPKYCDHKHVTAGIYGGHIRIRAASAGGRGTIDLPGEDRPKLAARLMGMAGEGLTMNELSQAIPPAYSKYLAEQWLLTRGERGINLD